jgi:hypothetical protein
VNNTADYIDIRDDRTNFYFGMKANETKMFRVLLNASYLGVYYLLACNARRCTTIRSWRVPKVNGLKS